MLKVLVGVALIVADIVIVKAEMIARHATVNGHPASSTGVWIVAAVALVPNLTAWGWIMRGGKPTAAQPARQGSYVSRRPR